MSAITGVARVNHGRDLLRATLDIEVERTSLAELAHWRVEVDGNLYEHHMGRTVGIRFLSTGNAMFVEGTGLVTEIAADEPLHIEGEHWRTRRRRLLTLGSERWRSTIHGIGPLYDRNGREVHWAEIDRMDDPGLNPTEAT